MSDELQIRLRDNIRLLGSILGDTIRSQVGEDLYNKVEEIRDRLTLDASAFDTQRKAPQVTDQIKKDIRWAREAGVNATPSVYINGRLQRKRGLESFSAAVEVELRKLGK